MKAYLWGYLPGLTGNWHSEGAYLVIADEQPTTYPEGGEGGAPMPLPEPTRVWDVGAAEPETFVFPDAGCC